MASKKILKLSMLLSSLMLLAALEGCDLKADVASYSAGESREAKEEIQEKECTYLSMATNGDWSVSFKGQIIEEELEALTKRAGGAMKIKLYDRSRLGDDAHLISGVQAGTLDIVQSSPSMQISVVPEAALFDIPGFFSTLEEWNRLFESDYRQVMEGYYEEAGLVLLDVFAYSYRNLSSRKPVVTPDDLQGVRIRTLENKYQEAFWESLCATAVPYRFAELYFCLSEGMADAQENLLDVMLVDNLYEVQSCITFTKHIPMVSAIAMNKEAYERLTDVEKEELKEFTGSLKANLIRQMPAEDERLIETLDNDYNIEIFEPAEELKTRIASGADVVLTLLREELGAEKLDMFMQAAEAVGN